MLTFERFLAEDSGGVEDLSGDMQTQLESQTISASFDTRPES